MATRWAFLTVSAVAFCAFGSTLAQAQQQPDLAPSAVALADGPAEQSGAASVGFTEEERTAIADRQQLGTIHRLFGVGTWLAMTATNIFGFIQYHDEYGLFDDEGQTPCATGDAVFESTCQGTPWPHAVLAFSTAALYFTTFTLSFLLPDVPEEVEHPNLGLHKALRWVHFGGIITQAVMGFLLSNVIDDFETRQAFATVHLGIGALTYGALSAAGAIMIF